MSFPKKLKNDAITTVAFEVRFHSDQMEELIVGRLADWADKKFPDSTKTRTGAADIPLALRKSNSQFINQSTLDIKANIGPSSSRTIRMGNSVFGYVLTGEYCGWETFEAELFSAVEALDAAVPLSRIIRLGLRYTNALRPDLHYISGLNDINFSLSVGNEAINESASTTFIKQVSENHKVACRIATPDHWNEKFDASTAVIADFDVSTVSEIDEPDAAITKRWIVDAHNFEKTAFESVLPKSVIEQLRGD